MKNELSFSGIEMTPTCARDLTARINSTSEDLAGMLKRAHDEKAWQALGYETWNAYVKAEIRLCKSRVFQLLDHAEIKGELEKSNMLDSATLPTSSRVTDELKPVPHEQRPAVYAAAVEAAGGKQPTAKQVEAAAFEIVPKTTPVKAGKMSAFVQTKDGSFVPNPRVTAAIAAGAVVTEIELPMPPQAEAKVIEGEVVQSNHRDLTPAMQHAHKIVDMLAQLSQFDPQERKRAFSYIVSSMVIHNQMSCGKRDQIKREAE